MGSDNLLLNKKVKKGKTVGDVLNTLTDEQLKAVDFLIFELTKGGSDDDKEDE